MPFNQGKMTFRVCYLPEDMPENAIERFANNAAGGLDGLLEEPEWGWVTSRHLMDTNINEDSAIVGGYIYLFLRQAERKIPTSFLKAECKMRECALADERDDGRVSGKDKQDIKRDVTEELLPKMPPTLSGTEFVIDHNEGLLYVGAPSQKKLDLFLSIFKRTIGFEPVAMTPEEICLHELDIDSKAIPSLTFTPNEVALDTEGTMGQDFLTWLWIFQDQNDGMLPESKLGSFRCMIDGPFTFIADGKGALESTIRKGRPTESAEAKAALLFGKKLKQGKIILAKDEEIWEVSLDADEFIFRSLSLPDGEAMDLHSIFEERMNGLYIFYRIFSELFKVFINDMQDPVKFQEFEKKAKNWVENRQEK